MASRICAATASRQLSMPFAECALASAIAMSPSATKPAQHMVTEVCCWVLDRTNGGLRAITRYACCKAVAHQEAVLMALHGVY